MRASPVLESPLHGDQIDKLYPSSCRRHSDLGLAGQRRGVSLPVRPLAASRHGHADSRSLGGQSDMDEDKRAFLRVPRLADGAVGRPQRPSHSRTARVIGATLDRNGLRPGRYIVTKDDLVVLASEAGVLSSCERHSQEGRLQPGRIVPGRYGPASASSATPRSRSSWPAAALRKMA